MWRDEQDFLHGVELEFMTGGNKTTAGTSQSQRR